MATATLPTSPISSRTSRVKKPARPASERHYINKMIVSWKTLPLRHCRSVYMRERSAATDATATPLANAATTTVTSSTTVETASGGTLWPKYPLLPHARTHDLRKALLVAWAEDKEHWRLDQLLRMYLEKHPPKKMGTFEKERFNAAIDAVVEAMQEGQVHWKELRLFFVPSIDSLRSMKVALEGPGEDVGVVIKNEDHE